MQVNRSLPIRFIKPSCILCATGKTALLGEATLLMHQMTEQTSNPWAFKKGVRLIEIGTVLESQEYIDAGWSFLRQLGK